MKKLSQINENIFDGIGKRSKGNVVRKEDLITEDYVRSYIDPIQNNSCKKITIRVENGKQIVDIEGSYNFGVFKMKGVEKIPFQFGVVTGDFSCFAIPSLKSLDGCPEKVGGNFSCIGCASLTSLEGAPKEVGGSFMCGICKSLTSLEGAPKEVGGNFSCKECKTKFTEEDVMKICNVGGNIFV